MARRITDRLADAGYTAFFAGGCVRDHLLGRVAKDVDIATSARPEEVEALFERTHAIGKAFGVIQVVQDEQVFEVATFRRDLAYTDGRRPTGIEPSTPEEDAKRRDFTINGLFMDPVSGEVIDFVGGGADMEAKLIRAIGDPVERFREDHLRLLRAIRFSSVLGFCIEAKTLGAIQEMAPSLARISVERIREEFTRLLTESPRPGEALERLADTGLLVEFLPEALDLKGCGQPPEFHPEGDVWVHTVMMLNELRDPSPELALAVLLHDIGKPATRTVDADGRIRFMGHAQVGADMARRWMRKMKFGRAITEDVVGMVDRHMNFMNVRHMRRATLRRMVGAPLFEQELELHRIDCLCSNGITESVGILRKVRAEYESELALPPPWICGKDLIDLGVAPGPEVGKWKNLAYDAQLSGEAIDRESLMAWLRRHLEN